MHKRTAHLFLEFFAGIFFGACILTTPIYAKISGSPWVGLLIILLLGPIPPILSFFRPELVFMASASFVGSYQIALSIDILIFKPHSLLTQVIYQLMNDPLRIGVYPIGSWYHWPLLGGIVIFSIVGFLIQYFVFRDSPTEKGEELEAYNALEAYDAKYE